jgi:hypothetical protein
MSNPIAPGPVEAYGHFSQHLGPRYMAAGLRIKFEYNQIPGTHFKVAVSEEYRESIVNGIKESMSIRFPDFPETGSIWMTEVTEHPIDSSLRAFYLAARCVIELAYTLTQLRDHQSPKQAATADN